MAYSNIANSEIDTDSPITASLASRWRDNPLAIASHDDSASTAPRVHCDAAAGNASALASTAAAGKVLRVSSTASPDGHGNLVVPEDLASSAPSVLHNSDSYGTIGGSSVSITLVSGKRYAIHASGKNNDTDTYIGYAYFNGSTLAWQHTVLGHGSISTSAFSLSGLVLTFNMPTPDSNGAAHIFAHEIVGPV